MTAPASVLATAAAMLAAAIAAGQDGMRGTARTIDGRTLAGTLVVADGKAVVTTETERVAIDVAQLVSFARADAIAATVASSHRIWLRSGGELAVVRFGGVAATAGKPAQVAVETPGGLRFEVPLSSLRAIRQGGPERPEPALFAADLRQPPSSDDLLYVVKNGKAQRSVVTVSALTDANVAFLLRGEAYEFELSGVTAVVFGDNTGFPPDRQPKPRTRILLTTGETLEGRLVALSADKVRCRIDEGATVDVPAERVLELQVASDRLAWLSELKPSSVEQTPAFDRVWPWTTDRTPAGAGLVLGGRPFTHGICMVPRTRLTWDLGGRYDAFEATIGIDDRGGADAHALLRVLVDGAVVWESGPRTRGMPPTPIRVELKKAKALALEADFGKNYDLGDYCVFADARVVQQ